MAEQKVYYKLTRQTYNEFVKNGFVVLAIVSVFIGWSVSVMSVEIGNAHHASPCSTDGSLRSPCKRV